MRPSATGGSAARSPADGEDFEKMTRRSTMAKYGDKFILRGKCHEYVDVPTTEQHIPRGS